MLAGKKSLLLLLVPAAIFLLFEDGIGSGVLEITVISDKNEYLVREPIFVTWTFKNITDTVICLPSYYVNECLKVVDSTGKIYRKRLLISYGFGCDTIWPGETISKSEEITDMYGITEEPESSYNLPSFTYSISYESKFGNSNELKIRIVQPVGGEKEAMLILKEAGELYVKREKRTQTYLKYLELVEKYPNSVYAERALDYAGLCFEYSRNLEEKIKSVEAYKKLIEKYPESRYVNGAFTSIMEIFRVLKDKRGVEKLLNELIKKHPNPKISGEARKRLKQVKSWKF